MADLPDPFLSFSEPAKAAAPSRGPYVPKRQGADWFSHAVTVMGLLFLGFAVYGLIDKTKLISLGYLDVNNSSAVVTLEIIYVGVGVGLLARRELIRELCIVIAMVAFVAAAYGTYRYVRQDNINGPAAVLATSKAQSRVSQLETDITKISAQNSADPSTSYGSELTTLDGQETSAQTQEQLDAGRERWNFSGLALAWVLALAPLALLTRPKTVALFA
ncbi:MAG TPA: hypothetical protein VHX66_00520 [Solirubrobacteraceae bacterium]|nr:hypothetical protein [Solirubrobacteraceae bacterium]